MLRAFIKRDAFIVREVMFLISSLRYARNCADKKLMKKLVSLWGFRRSRFVYVYVRIQIEGIIERAEKSRYV